MTLMETSRLITTFLCISFLLVFFQSTSSQPLSTNLLKAYSNNNDDGNVEDSIWIRPLPYLDSDELSTEEMLRPSSELLMYNENGRNNQPSSSSPVRRANFWKRANFWRKRANFWRRNLAA